MANVGWSSKSARESGRWLDLDRVLAGQVLPTARDIIDFIHGVNPTGRELDKREQARRYAMKARLQSLLIQRFSDELTVVPADKQGIVFLRHKYLGLGASHAVVAELDEEARAWVRLQLDLGVVEDAWTKAPYESEQVQRERSRVRRQRARRGRERALFADHRAEESADVEMMAALEEGRSAQADYDYEAARAAFERAHALAPHAPAPLAALLDFLVNRLGLDAEAMAIGEAAESSAVQSATVCSALALCAARLGDRERAETWGRALDGEAAAEVFRTLAIRALSAGDLSYAAETLERARQSLPSDPERVLVEAHLEQARAATVREDEARLATLVAAGDATAATALAHRIVERHPGSIAARAVLKEAGVRERQQRQRRWVEDARAAVVAGHFRQAKQALASARDCGASSAELAEVDAAIDAAEGETARLAHERRIGTVVAQLSGGTAEKKSAIVEFLGLGPHDRQRILGRCQIEELRWLDEVPTGAARCESIAAAVIAARTAESLLDANQVDEAERLLANHRLVLAERGFGQRLLSRLEGARQKNRQACAEANLEKADAAWRAKDLVQLKDLLDAIPRDVLSSSSLADFERLSQAVLSARQHKACMEQVDQRVAGRFPIVARQLLVERMSQSHDDEEQAALRRRLAEVDEIIRDVHCGIDHALPPGYLASEASEMIANGVFDRGVDTVLLPGGQTVVLLSVGQVQLAARLVDVDSGETRRLLAWSMMEAYTPLSMGMADGRVWLEDSLYHYVEISSETWLPCHQCDLRSEVGPIDDLKTSVALPGESVIWLRGERLSPPYTEFAQPFDTARGCPIPLIESCDEGRMCHVVGTKPPLLAWFPEGSSSAFVVSARGEDESFIDTPGIPLSIAVAPAGGYAILYRSKDEADRSLGLVVTDSFGLERARLHLPVAHQGQPGLAAIAPRGLLCVSYKAAESERTRLAYVRQDKDATLALAADVEIPGLTGIAQDDASSTAVALCRSARGVKMFRLDDMPISFPAAYDEFAIPRTFKFVNCSPPPDPEVEGRFRAGERIFCKGESDPNLADDKLEALAVSIGRSSEAASAYRILRFRGLHGRADRLLELMKQRKSDDFFVRLAIVEDDALAGRWTGDSLGAASTRPGLSEHLLHIRAVAELRAGRLDAVIAMLTGRAFPGECCLDGLLVLAQALKAEQLGEPMGAEDRARPCLATLVRTLFAADRALAQGDRDEVLRLLDQAWIRLCGEAQAYARLADLYLATTNEAPPLERFKASTFLIEFSGAQFAAGRHNQLWLGENTWSLARLSELEEKSIRWLLHLTWKPKASSCPLTTADTTSSS